MTNLYSIDTLLKEVEKYCCQQKEYEEQELAEIIQKYDFVVASEECKHKLMEVLPEGANIICSHYIDSPTTIYAIKKFDTKDYRDSIKIIDQESEEAKTNYIIDKLSKISPMILETAYLYATKLTLYGEDVTEKWLTATQNVSALEKAYQKGYYDALQNTGRK